MCTSAAELMSQQLWPGPSTENTFGCQFSISRVGDVFLFVIGVAEVALRF